MTSPHALTPFPRLQNLTRTEKPSPWKYDVIYERLHQQRYCITVPFPAALFIWCFRRGTGNLQQCFSTIFNSRPRISGLPGPSLKKCQTACKKMPNRFKKCQTSWNRLNAVGFDITRWVICQKHSGALNQALIIAYKATNNYCALEKQID